MDEIEARAKECNAAIKAAQTVGEREALPRQEEHIARIQQALNDNGMCVRSALGQSFSKWLKENPDHAQAYANLKAPGKTVQMKKDFRLRWAKREQEEKSTLKKSKLEAYQVVEGEEGTYEPLEMVVLTRRRSAFCPGLGSCPELLAEVHGVGRHVDILQ